MARPSTRRPKAPAEGVDPANTVIENTRPCAIFLPPVMVGGRRFNSHMLVPGQNNVPAAHFEAVKDKPGMRQYVKLEYLRDLGPGVAEQVLGGLDGLSDTDVQTRLAEIEDPNELITLREMTTSRALQDAINDRIRKLTAGLPPAAPPSE